MSSPPLDLERALRSLRGVALGDSLGLPYEGLKSPRNLKLMPLPLRQRLVAGWGAVSDDAAQSAMALYALALSPDDPVAFQRHFARMLRLWFWSLPPGVGLATIRACLKLSIGIQPPQSAVHSAGNGAAMRAAVMGAALRGDARRRVAFVQACAEVTHSHPDAIAGAQLVALAAAADDEEHFRQEARTVAPDWDWDRPGPSSGPTGYVVFSVNAALNICERFSTLPEALTEVIRLGGDTDTVGAMVGGILAARLSALDYPPQWDRWRGFPGPQFRTLEDCRPRYSRLLGHHVGTLPIILGHGFRRLLPPY